MKALLVKLSSLGDVVHTFPALSDAASHVPGLEVDWLVEEAFAPIARLHPAVSSVLPVYWRSARHSFRSATSELRRLRDELSSRSYDLVLDAQGLIKSALPTRFAIANRRIGFTSHAARERVAALAYRERVDVPRDVHAIDRLRALFAAAFAYTPTTESRYGLPDLAGPEQRSGIALLHGTSWDNKQWPERWWAALARTALAAGHSVLLPWGSAAEQSRALRIAALAPDALVAPALTLDALAKAIAASRGVVAVDSGLGHLAAALGVPVVGLFGPTDPRLTGLRGPHTANLASDFPCAPCLQRRCVYRGPAVARDGAAVTPPCFAYVAPERVWAALQGLALS
jgi:heptosyltransferase-1